MTSSRMPPKAKAPRKAANGYKLPDPLPEGEVIRNPHTKSQWRLGKSIGEDGAESGSHL